MQDQTEGRVEDAGMPGEEGERRNARGKHIDQISGARREGAENADKPCYQETKKL